MNGAAGVGGYPQDGVEGGRSLYAGHYLDYVVTPIYKIVSAVSYWLCFDELVLKACAKLVACIILFYSCTTEYEIECRPCQQEKL